MKQYVTEYFCEHCHLETLETEPVRCARCDRTFHTSRRVTNPDWFKQQELADSRRAEEAKERNLKHYIRIQEINEMKRNGWWGYRLVPDSEREELAQQLFSEMQS